jgi:hypothetical protein
MKLIECVPNFSEGRRPEVVAAIRDAIAGVGGAHVLDTSADASHNRCVITFVAPIDKVVDAAFAGIAEAQRRIDLTTHSGEHPRMGAADVVPFIPLEGSTMEDCIALARALGERVGRELDIPVFLYERAATQTCAAANLKGFVPRSGGLLSARRTSARPPFTQRLARSRSARDHFSSPTTCTSARRPTCRSRRKSRRPFAAPWADCVT